MNLNKFPIAILLFSLIISCKIEPIPAGIVTTVKGFVIDSVKNKRLANVTVEILGCRNYNTTIGGGIYCDVSVKTAKTNYNGEFSIDFNSDGVNIGYEAAIMYDDNYIRGQTVPLNIGVVNNIKLSGREFNSLKTHLIIKNTLYESLTCYGDYNSHILKGNYIDTIIFNKVLPNSETTLRYIGDDYKLGGARRQLDTIKIGSQDTTFYERTLDVSTFKKY